MIPIIISRIFDPFILGIGILIMVVLKSSLVGMEQVRFFLLIFIGMIGLPVFGMYVALKKGIISDWDMKNRRERPKVLIVLLCIYLLNFIPIRVFGDIFLFNIFIFFTLWILGFIVITLFFKISGHIGVLSLAVILSISWYGWWPAAAFIPLVAWARVKGKFHTIGQVTLGALYSLVIFTILKG